MIASMASVPAAAVIPSMLKRKATALKSFHLRRSVSRGFRAGLGCEMTYQHAQRQVAVHHARAPESRTAESLPLRS